MITKEEFEKGLWFYYKHEPDIYYKLDVNTFGNLYIISDSGQTSFDVFEIKEYHFDILINVLGQNVGATIYFYNLILKYDNTTRL